nr:MAG TPA: protein of unknown function (DUF4431) [Caudoviricetes sp.]DAY97780.1 MAG TPA: protein of unknown function (DUF4431) [Caudoviricetes sp.]
MYYTLHRDNNIVYKGKLFKDRTGSYHAPVVLKRCRSATRLDNLSFI